jgi:hypothetical protein
MHWCGRDFDRSRNPEMRRTPALEHELQLHEAFRVPPLFRPVYKSKVARPGGFVPGTPCTMTLLYALHDGKLIEYVLVGGP